MQYTVSSIIFRDPWSFSSVFNGSEFHILTFLHRLFGIDHRMNVYTLANVVLDCCSCCGYCMCSEALALSSLNLFSCLCAASLILFFMLMRSSSCFIRTDYLAFFLLVFVCLAQVFCRLEYHGLEFSWFPVDSISFHYFI